MNKIFVTRKIPEVGIKMLRDKGYEVIIQPEDRPGTKEEILEGIKGVDALLCLLTDKIDGEIMDAGLPSVKVIANYAVGIDNIDMDAAKERNLMITNTPGVLTNTVAEHTFTLMLSISHRISEADSYSKAGKYKGWAPELLLGNDLSGKTLGIVGLGRIGSRVAHHGVKGFDMKVIYSDPKRHEDFEKEYSAQYAETIEDLLPQCDYITLHVPLLDSTRHLINEERLGLMKNTAYLVNTSRGPVIDEEALTSALKNGVIKGSAIDVFENEPDITPELKKLDNVILTPHIASGTEETRGKMAELAAGNIIEVLEGRTPANLIK